jgi:hypothetical protein
MLPRNEKLKSLPSLNMSLRIGDIYLKKVRGLLFVRMLTLNLQSLSRSIPTKEVCLPAITAASSVTFELTVHRSILRSLESKSESQRKKDQALDLSRLNILLGNSSNTPTDLILLAVSVARPVLTNPSASSQSPMNPRITIFMRGY